jgi:predicted XRE-type DNA-binding protein
MNRPRTFTTAEAMIESVRELILTDRRPQREIAHLVGVSQTTINNLASGKTRWPRPTTLFPLLGHLGFIITIGKRE